MNSHSNYSQYRYSTEQHIFVKCYNFIRSPSVQYARRPSDHGNKEKDQRTTAGVCPVCIYQYQLAQTFDASRELLLRTWRIDALKVRIVALKRSLIGKHDSEIIHELVIGCVLYLLPGTMYIPFALLPHIIMPGAVYCICRAVFMVSLSNFGKQNIMIK